ncbi:MAG: hypothetical protein HFF50_06750 [Lawsonibacter sp.]|nr:hypothetical protein [Lawsonibacter sp.]
MRRKLLPLCLALALCLGLVPAAAANLDTASLSSQPQSVNEQTIQGRNSGSAALPKLSKEEIKELLAATYHTQTDEMYETAPSLSAPYAAGKMSQRAQNDFLARLNALRRLAGLPDVKLDAAWCDEAQHCSVLLAAAGRLSHTPTQPSDMDNAFFQKASTAAGTSNLYRGMYQITGIDELFEDSDDANLSALGHRRWQLNPGMTQVGFGFADSPRYGNFLTVKVVGGDSSPVDYHYVAWPASGNFPNDLAAFSKSSAWSVTINPKYYAMSTFANASVTLTRQSDGKVWQFSTGSSDGDFFLNTEGYGVRNCIIFRPDGVDKYEGLYTVSIQGLKDTTGAAADFSYSVDFFAGKPSDSTEPSTPILPTTPTTPTQPTEPTTPAKPTTPAEPTEPAAPSSFSDVKESDWFKPYVDKVTTAKLMTGMDGSKFGPGDNLTVAQAMVLAYQIHNQASEPPETLPNNGSDPWYMPYYQYCLDKGLVSSFADPQASLTKTATRYDMVFILDKAIPASRMEPVKTVDTIPDVPASNDTVYKWYRAGIVSGDERGSFNGGSSITRAEVAVILCQINRLV